MGTAPHRFSSRYVSIPRATRWYPTVASYVPWMCSSGIGRPPVVARSQPKSSVVDDSLPSTPVTVATAAKSAANSQPSRIDMKPSLDGVDPAAVEAYAAVRKQAGNVLHPRGSAADVVGGVEAVVGRRAARAAVEAHRRRHAIRVDHREHLLVDQRVVQRVEDLLEPVATITVVVENER